MRQLNGIVLTIFLSLVCNLAFGTVITNHQEEEEEGPIVHLKNGAIRGFAEKVYENININFFQGIRYGRAERFHKPTPEGPWTGVYDATKKRTSCPQLPIFRNISEGISEDCLFLNVWTHYKLSTNYSSMSVMVWFHGGGFQIGSIFEDSNDARFLSQFGDGIMVVSINYRLGPLGFASFGTKETPGNLGLYDQILGLKWVQENIHQFGGDPNKVTIFGQSAGSISVGALVLSDLTTGLFRRAILQSGAPNSRLVESRAVSLNRTVRFAQRLGCQGHELETALKCLQNKTAEELVSTTLDDFKNLDSFGPLYGDGDELLPESPAVGLKNFVREIDLMFGVVRNEGSMFIKLFIPDMDMENITPKLAINGIKQMLSRINASNKESQAILQHYTKNFTEKSTKNDLRNAVSDAIGDYLIVCPTVLFGEQVARRTIRKSHFKNYFYSYRMMESVRNTTQDDWMGVNHGDELPFLFGEPIDNYVNKKDYGTKSEVNFGISSVTILSWAQFAFMGYIRVSGVGWEEAINHHYPEQSSASYVALGSTNDIVTNYWKVTCDEIWKPVLEAHQQ